MSKGQSTAVKLREIRERAGLSMDALAKGVGYKGSSSYQRYEDESGYVRRAYMPPELAEKIAKKVVGLGSPPITRAEVMALAGLQETSSAVDIHRDVHPQRTVVSQNQKRLESRGGDKRTGIIYETLTGVVSVIGTVQAGAWREAYQLPENEWKEMAVPEDSRYPNVPRYALENAGPSMNKVCNSGGCWVFVFFRDIAGRGPKPGDYVIVERERKDGLVEATAKRFKLDSKGLPWLWPESDDPEHQNPIPLVGDEMTAEIRIVALVTQILNPV